MTAKNILVIAAHPDDEVLGCGGTIAQLSEANSVQIAILGEGATSRVSQPSQAGPDWVGSLETDARNAAKVLGVPRISFEGLPDNRFDELPLLDVVKRVERLIEESAPDTIYTHHPGDLNIDHQITFRAVLTASRPIPGCTIREIYSFEIPSSSEWAFGQTGPIFKPNVFVDIESTIETKIKGMECYAGEVRPFPHPRSPEALRAIARRWGSVAGLEYAEAFELIRSIR